MYTGHFGLDDGSFHGKAEGQEVYIGPQQAAVIARLRKVLAIADTAVAVSGPVGVGKTTLVRRALADLAGRKIIISVDRIRLEPDEVLDLLLSRFDVSRQPKGTIQRVAAFRRLLHERLADDTRVFIVVEDAERVGVDALLELEALTATDSGEPVGANIVLMGAAELSGLLAKPTLARLRQRVRLRQAVAPFDQAEVEGYMRHCLESAGGVLEQIFEPGTARIVHCYSGGIARVVDNLCESALVAAAEAGLATILPEFLQEVAENCGLEAHTEADEPAPPPAEAEAVAEAAAGDEVEDEASAPPAPLVAPPKLALVEPSPRAADEAPPEAAEDLPDPPTSQSLADVEQELSPTVADEAPEHASEAGSTEQHVDDWKSHERNVTVSRIDEVLPELIERLQSHARGRVRTTADASQRVDASSDDSVEIPTLSSSMRVAVLPVRPLEERPRTAEGVDGHEVSAQGQRPVSTEAFPVDSEAGEQEWPPEKDAGIAKAPSQPGRDAEQPVDTRADALPVEPPAEEDAAPVELVEDPTGAEPLPEDSADQDLPAAPATEVASAAGEIPEPEPMQVAEAAEAPQQALEDQDPPAAEAAEIEPAAEAAADDPPPVEESAAFELSLASENESAAVVADEPDDEVTTEAATLSLDEELTLAPDAATDVFAAGNDAVDAGEPELDALQAAIQAANAWQASETDGDEGPVVQTPRQTAAPDLPEITLDVELEKRKPAPNDLDRWADELSKAKSLEDISDILAETIFGNEEIEAISAGIRAKKATERAAQEEAAPAAAAPKPAPREPHPVAAKGPTPRPSPNKSASAAASRHQPKAPMRPAAGNGINMTMSQRIEMVNSLKGKKPIRPAPGMQVAGIVLAEQPDEPAPSAANGPQPIEAQIDTAITQSRKVLSEADLARLASSDDDDDDKGRRGLFGLFRRSSKT